MTITLPARTSDVLHRISVEVPALADSLERDLADVEEATRAAVMSPWNPFVTEVARHLIDAGGKRLRPVLALLGAQFGDPGRPNVVRAAVLVELVHVASLYHDDVIDEAPLRRGRPTVNSRWTNTVAVLVGDYLLCRAAEIGAEIGLTEMRMQAETVQRLVHGQVREALGVPAGGDPVAHTLSVLADKCGSLMSLAVELGAVAAGAPAVAVRALSRYAEALGVAFQLCDDILDITSSAGEAGKLPGIDLIGGVATLPVTLTLRAGGPEADLLRELMAGDGPPDLDTVDRMRSLLAGSVGLAGTRAELDRQLSAARAALTALPHGDARTALSALCDYVRDRTRVEVDACR